MKTRLFLTFLGVAACMAATAQASVIGSWSMEIASGSLDRWVLTLTPTAGETMAGFDISVSDTQLRDAFNNNGLGVPFSTSGNKGSFTIFLLHQTHSSGAVQDLVVTGGWVDDDNIKANLAVTADPGAYAAGFSSALALLEVVVPTGTIVSPMTELSVTSESYPTEPAHYFLPSGAPGNIIMPEPSTLLLLAAGLFGVFCYAWRKRK